MILYKYRADSEFTKNIFINRKVWMSSPGQLNDPFECSIQTIMNDFISNQVKKEKMEQIEGFILAYVMNPAHELMWGLPKYKIKNILDKMGREKKFGKKYKLYKDFIYSRTGNYPSNPSSKYQNINKQINSIGIFSLSEKVDNELMWGHYADGSRGIAIGFSVEPNTKLKNENHCLKVTYSNDDIILSKRLATSLVFGMNDKGYKFYQRIAWNDPFFQSVISTKTEAWSYECEWRYVEETSGLYDLPAPIKEVVFGLKCPKVTRDKYIKLVKDNISNYVEFYEIVNVNKKLQKRTIE